MRAQIAPSVSNSPKSALKLALLTGAMAAAALLSGPRAHADTGLCANGTRCGPEQSSRDSAQHFFRFSIAHDQANHLDGSLRLSAVTAKDYPSFSGVGVISCIVDGKQRTSTAFLVGAFDIGVTVAHTFQKTTNGADPSDCTYNSLDSLGQVRERIPVSYVKSQWDEDGATGQVSKDLAVVRLSQPSRYAQRTMPLGRFSGSPVSAVMVGYNSDIDSDSVKRKARGMVYGHPNGSSSNDGFMHDMDSRDIAPGAPVIDETTGVIIGVHTQSAHNTMITMDDWLESTLRAEMKQEEQQREARAN